LVIYSLLLDRYINAVLCNTCGHFLSFNDKQTIKSGPRKGKVVEAVGRTALGNHHCFLEFLSTQKDSADDGGKMHVDEGLVDGEHVDTVSCCTSNTVVKRKLQQTLLNHSKQSNSVHTLTSKNPVVRVFSAIAVTMALYMLIIRCQLPFKIVNHSAFKHFMQVVCPEYNLCSDKTVRKEIVVYMLPHYFANPNPNPNPW